MGHTQIPLSFWDLSPGSGLTNVYKNESEASEELDSIHLSFYFHWLLSRINQTWEIHKGSYECTPTHVVCCISI